MPEPTLDGDGIETGLDVIGAADDGDVELAGDLVLDDGGDGEDAVAALAEGLEQGAVVEVADDEGVDALGVEPELERAADGGGVRGQEHGGGVEGAGKALGEVGEFGSGEEGDAAFAEQVVEGADADGLGGGGVGDDGVELVEGEGGEELGEGAFAAGDVDVGGDVEGGLEEALGDELGDDIGDADGEAEVLAGGEAVDDVLELVAEAEDVIGVAQDGAADVGEDEAAALPLEELVAERLLEEFELGADGGLGEAEFLAGLGDGAGAGDGPEVEEVVVVEPAHARGLRGEGRDLTGKHTDGVGEDGGREAERASGGGEGGEVEGS